MLSFTYTNRSVYSFNSGEFIIPTVMSNVNDVKFYSGNIRYIVPEITLFYNEN